MYDVFESFESKGLCIRMLFLFEVHSFSKSHCFRQCLLGVIFSILGDVQMIDDYEKHDKQRN